MKYIHKVIKEYTAKKRTDVFYDVYNEDRSRLFAVPTFLIENSNDWELQIEKDYEILSFKSNQDIIGHSEINKGHVVSKAENDVFMGDGVKCSLERFLQNPKWDIHSVKRISDQEVFQLGDNREGGKIVSFRILSNGELVIDFDTKRATTSINSEWLNSKSSPLFTTEDGVEMYDRKTYFLILSSGSIIEAQGNANGNYEEEIKRFSTKAAAEAYLDKEKKEKVIEGITEKYIQGGKDDSYYEAWNQCGLALFELYDTLTKK